MTDVGESEVDAPQPLGPASGGDTRRSLIKKGAVGAAVAWTAPTLLSSPASAGPGTGAVPPSFVTNSEATDYSGPSGTNRSILLGSSGLVEDDLWMALLAYDARGSASINIPTGPGWFSHGPVLIGNTGGATPFYTLRAYVVWRVLESTDLSGGTFSLAVSSSSNDITFGGLRGAAVAYHGTDLQALVTSNSGSAPNGLFQNIIATSSFPAATGAPLTDQNVVVRLGAARGYGGVNALNDNIGWRTAPGTQRLFATADASSIGFNTENFGDRALSISDQDDDAGQATNGTWYRNASTIPLGNWATFTALVRNTP